MGAKARVAGGSVAVCEASGCQDDAGLHARLEALLLESEGLEVWEGETEGGALRSVSRVR